MSFKCPECRVDFGYDQKGLWKHLGDNLDCGREALELINFVKRDK